MKTGSSLLAVTDHDTLRGSLAARAFARRFDLPITIPTGIEFSTERGHVLVYGLAENPYEGRRGTPFSDVRRLADEQNALLVLAHPNWKSNRVAWESGQLHEQRLAGDFDAFEIINGEEDYQELIAYYDEYQPFSITCGSDSHHYPHGAGSTLWIPCEAGDEVGCLRAVREGRVAVYASPTLKGRNEKAFGQERWLGDPDIIEEVKKWARQPACNLSGVQISFDHKHRFPGQSLTLRLTCEQPETVRLRLPAEHIDQSIALCPDSAWEHTFTVENKWCDDYCYALVQHPGGRELADSYIARPIQTTFIHGGLRLRNESPLPACDTRLEIPILPHTAVELKTETPAPQLHMPRFTSWGAMAPTPISLNNGDGATHAWAWDEEHCYCQVIVNKPEHCQPFENNGLWEGDCVRLGILPGNANPPCPKWETINKVREPNPIPLDGALTPDGTKLAIRYKLFDTEHDGNRLSVTRQKTETIYQFVICWDTLKLAPPQADDILFLNGQLHLHDGKTYQGFEPFSVNNDLASPTLNWLRGRIEESS